MSNVDDSIQLGNLLRIQDAKGLSLVGYPANQTAFKVVRKDGSAATKATKASEAPATVKRVSRSVTNPVLRLGFKDLGVEEINQLLKDYGMEDYTISAEEGTIVATRADVQSFAIENTEAVVLRTGVTAYVEKPEAKKIKRADTQKHLRVVGYEFDAKRFDTEQASAWLAEHDAQADASGLAAEGDSLILQRGAVAENVELRRMEVAPGAVVILVQDDVLDVPVELLEVISESAYGNWGWGQLDFNARLADRAFCDAMSDALYILRDTLDTLVFYSGLPLDVRQQLIANALSQFHDYVLTMMSILPRQVLVAVRADSPQLESKTVTTDKTTTKENAAAAVARTDASAPDTQTDATVTATSSVERTDTTAFATEAGKITLTQEELDARVEAEIAKRADAAAAAAKSAAPTTESAAVASTTETQPTLADLLTRMDNLATAVESLQATNTAVQDRVTRMESATVVRSDTAGADDASLRARTSVARQDVWAGLLVPVKEG